MAEDYLSKYCSETLCQLSLQNSSRCSWFIQDTQKPLTSVKTLQVEGCVFDYGFTFQRIFPNLETLTSGFNSYLSFSTLIVNIPTLKHLTILFTAPTFQENNAKELLKLNPQLENPRISFFGRQCTIFDIELKCDIFEHIKECFPSVQRNYRIFPCFNCDKFLNFGDTFKTRNTSEIYPTNLSNEYKKNLEDLYVLYLRNIYRRTPARNYRNTYT